MRKEVSSFAQVFAFISELLISIYQFKGKKTKNKKQELLWKGKKKGP